MKNSTLSNVLLACLALIIFIASCRKNDHNKPKTALMNILEDHKYLNQRLKKFAVDFAPVLGNAVARNLIRNKAKLKFDEEYEVLINDIFKEKQIHPMVLKDVNESLHNDLYSRSGERLYPQIYIPRLQYLEEISNKSEPVAVTAEDTIGEEPVYVFYSGDPEVDSAQSNEIYPGYRLVNGQYEFFTLVDEDYANEHEVWVFSINETVNEHGLVPVPCDIDPCAPGCPYVPGCGGGNEDPGDSPDDDPADAPRPPHYFPDLGHNKINFMIQNMRVTAHRESWLAGASEVSIRAKLVCHNGRNLGIPGSFPDEYTSDQYSNYSGKLIKKIKRKDIKNGKWFMDINYSLQRNWQNEVPSQDPVHFIYTIFERDKYVAPLNKDKRYALDSPISNEVSPRPFDLFYRAEDRDGNDIPYARYHFTNTLLLATAGTYAGSGIVHSQSGGISFNTVTY